MSMIWSSNPDIQSKLKFQSSKDDKKIQSFAKSQAKPVGHWRHAGPEEIIRQKFICQLIEWGIPADSIIIEYPIRMGSKTTFADIAVLSADHQSVRVLIECKVDAKVEDRAQLTSYQNALGTRYGIFVEETYFQFMERPNNNTNVLRNEPEDMRKWLFDIGVLDVNIETIKSLGFIGFSNRRYLGCKTDVLEFIDQTVGQFSPNPIMVFDTFGGTGVVGAHFANAGSSIIINDLLYCNFVTYKAFFSHDEYNLWRLCQLMVEWNDHHLTENDNNYYSEHFGNRYFTMENARKIGWIREQIEKHHQNKFITDREYYILLSSLLIGCDKVANTVGHYDAYRAKMDKYPPFKLRMLDIPQWNPEQKFYIHNASSNQLVKEALLPRSTIAYLDPPYNSRQYSDCYHVLENIAKHEQPAVFFKTQKMDRKSIKSDYCTVNAPVAFKELIDNLDTETIIVSYNSTEQKANARSNAKISGAEIIEILSQKGDVQIFEKEHKAFSTGQSDITDNRELLYCVTVGKFAKPCQSPMNYTGGKYKLIKQIFPLFPTNLEEYHVIDGCTGGANIGINLFAKRVTCIDTNPQIIGLYNVLQTHTYAEVVASVESIVQKYNLSDTSTHGYEHYNCNSSDGLKSYNKSSYIKMRTDYNALKEDHDDFYKASMFYTLILFGFSNQIRFNKSGEYNIPVGKRDFNQNNKKKLEEFMKRLSAKGKQITFVQGSLMDIDISQYEGQKVLAYVDPPYLITTASYNEQGGWNEDKERALLDFLNKLDAAGHKFALSNVLEHKGKENTILKLWLENNPKYICHSLDHQYNNSNYQAQNTDKQTHEVLIVNYHSHQYTQA